MHRLNAVRHFLVVNTKHKTQHAGSTGGAGLGGGATRRGGKGVQALRGSNSGDAAPTTRPQLVPAGLAPQPAL